MRSVGLRRGGRFSRPEPALLPPTFKGFTDSGYGTGARVENLELPAGTTEGDYLLLVLMDRQAFVAPNGWEVLLTGAHYPHDGENPANYYHSFWVFGKTVGPAEPPVTLNWTGNLSRALLITLDAPSGVEVAAAAVEHTERTGSAFHEPVTAHADVPTLAIAVSTCTHALSVGNTQYVPSTGELLGSVTRADNRLAVAHWQQPADQAAEGRFTHYLGEHHGVEGLLLLSARRNPPAPAWQYEVFLTDGVWDWTAAGEPQTVDVLRIDGGGGGGGTNIGNQNVVGRGGGGAGGFAILESIPVAGNVTVTIGQGGSGYRAHATTPTDSLDGGASSFGDLTGVGGGRGGGAGLGSTGGDGGSGGGSGFRNNAGGAGTPGLGHAGGSGLNTGSGSVGGGGGGAGGAGEDIPLAVGGAADVGRAGGAGVNISVLGWGNAVPQGALPDVAGGGGGGAREAGGEGPATHGAGMGGRSGHDSPDADGLNAFPGTGSGGGGRGHAPVGGAGVSAGTGGGDGASGMVIVRWRA